MTRRHVLVAGGAGFLGSHLCESLLERGDRVTAIDNFCTGSIGNTDVFRGNSGFNLIEHDITKSLTANREIIAATEKDAITDICNLASPASPPTYMRLAIETLQAGSVGVQNLLDFAETSNARFLQASTSEIYGDPDVHPQPESYWGRVNPIGPRSMYDESKRFAEAMCVAYERHRNIDLRIVRIFNTYGPRLAWSDGRVVTNLLAQAMRNEPLTILGDGSQTRSFCYVTDEVAGIIALLDSNVTGPVNIGNPQEVTILELATLICELTSSRSEVMFLPFREDDPMQRQPNIDRASSLLGWNPKVDLREGLSRTIEWLHSTPEFRR